MRGVVFFGRVHHALKMAQLVNGLIQRNVSVGIAITDNSINIDPPNEFFNEFNIDNFNHVKEYISLEDASTLDHMMLDMSSMHQLPTLHKTIPPFWMASTPMARLRALKYLGLS